MRTRPALPALIAAALAFGLCVGASAQARPTPPAVEDRLTARFQPTAADFPNPERGFYRAASTTLDALADSEVQAAYADGYRLIYVRINLEPYRAGPIPADVLARLEAALTRAHAGGVKLIVRATYNYPRGETEYRDAQDAPLPVVLEHLEQLKPLFAANSDVIAFVQAGFIGAWGEWHTSSNDLTTPEAKARIRDALLDAVPATRFVQFRYPPDLQAWAATGVTRRIGFHNDCFLASVADVGTYDEDPGVREEQRAFTDRLGDTAPFGGETCNPADEAGPTPRTGCDDILSEGARFNLVYLNDGYYRRLFHQRWSAGGCMDQVRRSMGYRLEVVDAVWPDAATAGQRLEIDLTLRNTGWARLANPRAVQIVLRNPESGAVRRLNVEGVDPRDWLPGQTAAVRLGVALPADLPSGRWQVSIALPDPHDRLKNDPRYAIRFANSDDRSNGQAWDGALGAFSLGAVVQISRQVT